MLQEQEDLLPEADFLSNVQKRKALVPVWIKVFSWIFLVFGIIAPFAFILALFGGSFSLSLYGFSTNDPLSVVGICIMIMFLLKGITAYCLLWQKDPGVMLALIDAMAGILVCTFATVYPFFSTSGYSFSLRLELILLVPYLLRMLRIKAAWEGEEQS